MSIINYKPSKSVDFGYSDDYASLTCNDLHFYYGYEVAYGDGEDTDIWCFEVSHIKRNKKGMKGFKSKKPIFLMTTPQIQNYLPNTYLKDPRDFLLAGIGLFNEQLDKKLKKIQRSLPKSTKKKSNNINFIIAEL